MTFPVEVRRDGAAELHALGLPDPVRRLVRRCDATAPAVVLGSVQPEPAGAGVAGPVFVRRRSGGGAVLVGPGRVLWVDVVVPAGDELWHDDVGLSFGWLGEAWVAALASCGVPGRAHRGKLVQAAWSRDVCFAGLGPGEVVRPDGRKVVGIAQRRTRAGALFQCAALLEWDPGPLVAALGLPARAAAELAGVAAGLDLDPDALFDAFVAVLP